MGVNEEFLYWYRVLVVRVCALEAFECLVSPLVQLVRWCALSTFSGAIFYQTYTHGLLS